MVPEDLTCIIHTVILVIFFQTFPVHIFQNSCNHVVLIIYPDFLKPSVINVTYACNNKKSGNTVNMNHTQWLMTLLMALVMKIYHLFNNPHITGYLDSIFLLCYYEGNKYCNVCFFMHIDSSRVLTVFLGENSTKEISG